ncbi:hypothetical protein GCM10010329_08160 [Streptomyces spiroverticillatus]|uniref:Uncharacterized protein n=1 Tax=Streptomyces finlayi TaxID=67296 RepID=A0A919C866_9ACTN|nr:hypothetical protein [Streptomyces finlayi]GGZ90039.1 hypothetical protein GCM10010329_08160 [Streptomyces spiroverticillatus]GHC80818.1 hypothetical protein GCM10010334_08150 [Streptomyces finlayi]
MYTTEMAYVRMRELQELANRSRAHKPAATTASVRSLKARLKRSKQG